MHDIVYPPRLSALLSFQRNSMRQVFSNCVKIVEVSPRDGLQNESKLLDWKQKLHFIQRLAVSGVEGVEVGSFVSPKRVPQVSIPV